MNDTIELMHRHRSVRRYTDEPVRAEHIRAAVAAGQSASTSSAVQSYCMIRVTDAGHRERLVELTGGQQKIAGCGAFFVICGDTRRHRLLAEHAGVPYDARLEAFLLAVVDATLFAQNVVLAFESLGYGICYIGGLRNQLEDVDRLLGLPAGVYPVYGLCVGIPDEQPSARPRLPLEAVYFEGRYPDDDAMRHLVDAYDEDYLAYLQNRGPGRAPRRWSESMVGMFSEPRRAELGPYYRGKGADLR